MHIPQVDRLSGRDQADKGYGHALVKERGLWGEFCCPALGTTQSLKSPRVGPPKRLGLQSWLLQRQDGAPVFRGQRAIRATQCRTQDVNPN